MARRYDSSTTTFSPEGRLHQVEYAIEAINNAGTCVGILCADGIVLAAERKTTSKLLAPSKSSDKIYQIDGHISTVVAGTYWFVWLGGWMSFFRRRVGLG